MGTITYAQLATMNRAIAEVLSGTSGDIPRERLMVFDVIMAGALQRIHVISIIPYLDPVIPRATAESVLQRLTQFTQKLYDDEWDVEASGGAEPDDSLTCGAVQLHALLKDVVDPAMARIKAAAAAAASR